MRIMHLSWEYPPLVYGGLGRHVHALAEEQASQGHDVCVITQTELEPGVEQVNGVTVVRTRRDQPIVPFDADHLLAWVSGLEHSLVRSAISFGKTWQPDVVHAHDWMVTHVAAAARQFLERPVVATLHATEAGRHQGWLPEDLSVSVHNLEWQLTQYASRIIACSQHMQWEVTQLFGVPKEHVDIIPNGIHLDLWRADPAASSAARARHQEAGPLLVYSGRLEWEKGVHTLLRAMPTILRSLPETKVVIAGRGGMADELVAMNDELSSRDHVEFVGWLPEAELHGLVACADLAIVPSLYEPFGLVALEAAALGTAVLVADSGGLAEFAAAGNATSFPAGEAKALAAAVLQTIGAEDAREQTIAHAHRSLATDYTWGRIAEMTIASYVRATQDFLPGELPDQTPPEAPSGNLLKSASTPLVVSSSHATGRPD